MVAEATHLIAGVGGVCFPSEFSITASAFSLGQVLNFGSLAYIADCYGELHPLKEVAPVDSESLASSPPLSPLGADLEVLAWQIKDGLGLTPNVLECRQMFYMLANIHYQIATSEVLTPPEHFWHYLLDLPFGIQNVAASF
jgi:hypothetical protein